MTKWLVVLVLALVEWVEAGLIFLCLMTLFPEHFVYSVSKHLALWGLMVLSQTNVRAVSK